MFCFITELLRTEWKITKNNNIFCIDKHHSSKKSTSEVLADF